MKLGERLRRRRLQQILQKLEPRIHKVVDQRLEIVAQRMDAILEVAERAEQRATEALEAVRSQNAGEPVGSTGDPAAPSDAVVTTADDGHRGAAETFDGAEQVPAVAPTQRTGDGRGSG